MGREQDEGEHGEDGGCVVLYRQIQWPGTQIDSDPFQQEDASTQSGR